MTTQKNIPVNNLENISGGADIHDKHISSVTGYCDVCKKPSIFKLVSGNTYKCSNPGCSNTKTFN